jgi:hypothetical protein
LGQFKLGTAQVLLDVDIGPALFRVDLVLLAPEE